MTGPQAAVESFLAAHGWSAAARRPLAGDASGRRYQRLLAAGERALLMEAPPPGEKPAEFIAVAGLLAKLGLSAPRVLAVDAERGLLLIEDFGDDTYSLLLDQGAAPAPLYHLAVDTLVHLHRHFDAGDPTTAALPRYDGALLIEQAALFCDSHPAPIGKIGADAKAAFVAAWRTPVDRALAVPRSLLLRDFHAGNLFHLPERPGIAACGLIDFQDAGIGPVTYDLISLLQDARREVPAEAAASAMARYQAAHPELPPDDFEASCAVLAAQRHVRVIAVFARLAAAGKPGYSVHLPRLWRLLARALEHPALADVRAWFARHAPIP
jgi:hypothetical protein